jgi:Lysylphosphatidylglycerol synthase TM region
VRDAAADLAAGLEGALAGLADAVAGAALGWLALGVVLHLANQVARGGGWFAIVRAACDDDPRLRRRDAIAAWVAGAGAGGVASARGGDAVRVLLLARRVPRAGCPVLAGTLVAEGVGELAVGLALLAVALLVEVGPELGVSATSLPYALTAVAVVAVAFVAGSKVAPVRRLGARVGHGCVLLRTPGSYARGVLPWQGLSRVCRLGALACFLTAFGLPATPAAVLLVVFAQGGSRLLPFAPASVGAGAAMVAAMFAPVTGAEVPAGQVAAFFVGTSTVLTVVGTVLTSAVCVRAVRWRGVGELVRVVRRAPVRA